MDGANLNADTFGLSFIIPIVAHKIWTIFEIPAFEERYLFHNQPVEPFFLRVFTFTVFTLPSGRSTQMFLGDAKLNKRVKFIKRKTNGGNCDRKKSLIWTEVMCLQTPKRGGWLGSPVCGWWVGASLAPQKSKSTLYLEEEFCNNLSQKARKWVAKE